MENVRVQMRSAHTARNYKNLFTIVYFYLQVRKCPPLFLQMEQANFETFKLQ